MKYKVIDWYNRNFGIYETEKEALKRMDELNEFIKRENIINTFFIERID